MKKNRVIGIIMTVLLILQMIVGIPSQAIAVAAPPQLTAAEVAENQVSLSWTDVAGVTAFEIMRSDNDGQSFTPLNSQTDRVYLDTSVEAYKKYKYQVIARINADTFYNSNAVTVYTDITPPTLPVITAPASTPSSITISWSPSTDNSGLAIDRYKIYVRNAGQSQFTYVNSTTEDSFTYQNLQPNTLYYFYVTAVDWAGNESVIADNLKNQNNIYTLPDNEVPQAPTVLNASVISDTRIDLTWSGASDNIGVVSYTVYRATTNTFSSFTTYSASSASYSATGLTSGVTYYFKVKALDASGNISDFSPVASAATLTDTQKPTPPTIWAQALSTTQVKLTWSGATDNKAVVSYEIYRATGSGSFSRVTTDDASPYYDNGVSSGNTYKYYIKAKDAAGNISDASNTVTVTTNGDTQDPSKPLNLRLSLVSNTEVKLTWDNSTDNKSVSGYKIYRALDSESYSWIASTSSATTYNNSGLSSGRNYKYYVRAFDAAGNESNDSDIQTIYTSTAARTDTETISYSQGGTLEITDLVRLDVPRDALTRNADYKIVTKVFGSYSNTGYKTFGQPVEITAKSGSSDITSFDEELTITFYYTSSELSSTDESDLAVYYWDDTNDKWVVVPSTVSSSSNKVTAKVDHLTVFALLADTNNPSVPTLSNSSSSSKRIVGLTGKAENNSKVTISFNNSTLTVNADSRGSFSKEVMLRKGTNEIRLRAEDSSGHQSAWSSTYTINCSPANELYDISGHWAEYNIQKVLELSITGGYEDKTFRPDRTITRAEFAKFVVSSLDLSPVSSPSLNFSDKGNVPSWATGYIARAVQEGIISGYADNTFRAGRAITRQEMASMLVRALDLQSEADGKQNAALDFNDEYRVEKWARGAVAVAVDEGLIKGYSDNTFKPANNATRAEAVTMIVKLMEIK